MEETSEESFIILVDGPFGPNVSIIPVSNNLKVILYPNLNAGTTITFEIILSKSHALTKNWYIFLG